MALNVGDKCPQCKEGLIIRSELGIECDECSFSMDIDEVVAEVKRGRTQRGTYTYKARKFSLILDDPEKAEELLRGLILARQNNNSEYFPEMIDAINEILQPWRAAKLAEELAA